MILFVWKIRKNGFRQTTRFTTDNSFIRSHSQSEFQILFPFFFFKYSNSDSLQGFTISKQENREWLTEKKNDSEIQLSTTNMNEWKNENFRFFQSNFLFFFFVHKSQSVSFLSGDDADLIRQTNFFLPPQCVNDKLWMETHASNQSMYLLKT